MQINELRSALCYNRQQTATGPDPGNWLKPVLPQNWTTTTFHYFIRWGENPLAVSEACPVTLLVDLEHDEPITSVTPEAIARAFNGNEASKKLETAQRILSPHQKRAFALLLPEHPAEPVNFQTPIWHTNATQPETEDIKTITVRDLAIDIRKHRGQTAPIGQKGLTYGTSAVECFLSKTQDSFPGDADCVIADDIGQIRFVIEYKKHNTKGPIARHLANRYYKNGSDRRKYQSLQALATAFSNHQDKTPEIHILYYAPRYPYQIRLQHIRQVQKEQLLIGRDTGDKDLPDLNATTVQTAIAGHLFA